MTQQQFEKMISDFSKASAEKALRAAYAEYASYFEESTECDPMPYDHWLAIPQDERPGF